MRIIFGITFENTSITFCYLFQFQAENYGDLGKSYEERRVEKMIRKTGRDIYKLRKTRVARGQLDVHSFK